MRLQSSTVQLDAVYHRNWMDTESQVLGHNEQHNYSKFQVQNEQMLRQNNELVFTVSTMNCKVCKSFGWRLEDQSTFNTKIRKITFKCKWSSLTWIAHSRFFTQPLTKMIWRTIKSLTNILLASDEVKGQIQPFLGTTNLITREDRVDNKSSQNPHNGLSFLLH
jgi:hypothetical protein